MMYNIKMPLILCDTCKASHIPKEEDNLYTVYCFHEYKKIKNEMIDNFKKKQSKTKNKK